MQSSGLGFNDLQIVGATVALNASRPSVVIADGLFDCLLVNPAELS